MQVVPVGWQFDALWCQLHQGAVDLEAGLGHQHLEHPLGLLVIAFTEAMVANLALGVDEVQSGPVVVVERLPDGIIVVDSDWVADIQCPYGRCTRQ
jgi:hypothetical protein